MFVSTVLRKTFTKANFTMCFLFSVSYCLSLVLMTKKTKDKQQETGNKEHVVELV